MIYVLFCDFTSTVHSIVVFASTTKALHIAVTAEEAKSDGVN